MQRMSNTYESVIRKQKIKIKKLSEEIRGLEEDKFNIGFSQKYRFKNMEHTISQLKEENNVLKEENVGMIIFTIQQDELHELKIKNKKLLDKHDEIKATNNVLTHQINKFNINPKWNPNELLEENDKLIKENKSLNELIVKLEEE